METPEDVTGGKESVKLSKVSSIAEFAADNSLHALANCWDKKK
jgi:hypothetical protein